MSDGVVAEDGADFGEGARPEGADAEQFLIGGAAHLGGRGVVHPERPGDAGRETGVEENQRLGVVDTPLHAHPDTATCGRASSNRSRKFPGFRSTTTRPYSMAESRASSATSTESRRSVRREREAAASSATSSAASEVSSAAVVPVEPEPTKVTRTRRGVIGCAPVCENRGEEMTPRRSERPGSWQPTPRK